MNLNTSKEDLDVMLDIAQRADDIAFRVSADRRPISYWVMDLEQVHKSNPLQLQELAAAADGDFAHDVFGIARHLDRSTGKLKDCFSPRYSKTF